MLVKVLVPSSSCGGSTVTVDSVSCHVEMFVVFL